MTKPKSRLRPVPVTSVERQLAREIIELSNGTQLASIDLGRDGAKWRHGWIPLNPVAAAIKAKKWKGHGGNEPKPGVPRHAFKTRPNVKSEPSGPGRTKLAPPRERAKAMIDSRKLPAGYTTHKPAAGFTTTIMDEKGRTVGTISKRDDRKYHAQHGESDKVTEHSTFTEAQSAVLHQHSFRTAAGRGGISRTEHPFEEAAEAARVKKIVDDGNARKQAERDAELAAKRAKAIVSAKHAMARGEAGRKRFAEIPKGIKPTVTKNDTTAKEKARGIIEARLKSEPIDAHSVDVAKLEAGQSVKFKVSKFEETAQPPHTKSENGGHGPSGEYLTRFEHPEFGNFTTDQNGVVRKEGARWDRISRSMTGGTHSMKIIDDAHGSRTNFTSVGNDIVYRHHDVTGKPKYVGEEERVGHVVHAGSGVVHVSDGKHTYTAAGVSRGRLSGNFGQRNPEADKKMVADYLGKKVSMRSSSGDFGRNPTISSTRELYARGEAAFRARMAAKKAK